MTKWLCLVIGSVAGGAARYGMAGWVYRFAGTRFPYGTLLVNLSGCFLIGAFSVLSEEKFLLSPDARTLLMVGFCGAFTTFSTFMLETSNLMKTGEMMGAAMNVGLSVVLGFLSFRIGEIAARLI